MMTAESQQLLADYVESGSERAFQELVARYVDLVYSTAFRLVEGDSHRAQDVAQMVFVDLARLAPTLSPNPQLGGWLHRHTCFVARTVMRGERRRQARERQAVEMSTLDNHPEAALNEVAAVLDEAIHELGADDRDAILLRFFERRNLRSVGEALGLNENVAQKRVARAVQELATLLCRRGFSLSAAALAAGLAGGVVKAAPAGLALSLAQVALAKTGAAGATVGSAAKLALMTKLKVGLLGATLVAGLGTIVWLQFPARTRPQDEQHLAQPASATSPASEQAGAPTTAPESLASAQEPASAPASQPSAEPPPIAKAGVAAGTLPSLPAAAIPEATFPAGAVPQRFYARSGSRLRIAGTSSLGNWQADSEIITGFLELEPNSLNPALQPGPVQARAEAAVPISSLKSVDARGRPFSDQMDQVIHACLSARGGSQPKLTVHLTGFTLKKLALSPEAPYEFLARANLAVAGVTNPMVLPVSVWRQANGNLKLSSRFTLLMTSFGIEPPELNLANGYFQAANPVSIQFDWMVGPKNREATVSRRELVPLLLELPLPGFKSVVVDLPRGDHIEPLPTKPRPPMLVPPGLTNLARAAKLTCSDRSASAQGLARITSGNKQADEQNLVFLRKGAQWVQLDLGRPCELFAIALWHAHDAPKVYHDVVVQVADDPDFTASVQTLFNNDRANALGLGAGTDREYRETYEGKLIDAKGVEGRYLRFYSKGSTQSALNEYSAIEVYGRRVP